MILGIDTSAQQCAVALLGSRIYRRVAVMDRGHAEALFPMIEAVLGEAQAGYDDLSRVAVCTGPGSFTGLRVGIAAARGLAMARGVPAIGITRFEAIAAQTGADEVRLPAPRGGVFVQRFRDGMPDGPPSLQAGEAAAALADPATIARLAADRPPGAPPAPLYLRDADAAPPREAPPRILDP